MYDWGVLRDAGWVQVILALLGIGGLIPALRWIWRWTIYKNQNHELRFIDHMPPGHNEEPFSVFKSVPMGEHELSCFVRSRYGSKIKEINFRFLNADLSNVSPEVVHVKTLGGWNNNRLGALDIDTEGGIEAEYPVVRVLSPNEALYFRVGVSAKQSWSGQLSFRAKDDTGFRMFARHPFRVLGA